MSHWVDSIPDLSLELRDRLRGAANPMGVALAEGVMEGAELLTLVAHHFRVPCLQLTRFQPDPEALALISEEQARRVRAVPLFKLRNQLFTAVTDPQDLGGQDFLARLTGLSIEPVLALPKDIEDAITRWMVTEEKSSRILDQIAADQDPDNPLEQQSQQKVLEDREAPTIRMVDHIFAQAIRLGASDIHLEPGEATVTLRYRIDGHLRAYPAPPKAMYAAVVSRIKISGGLDIAERRLPQDGRASTKVDGRKYDLRISVIPNLHGEGVVIRILNPYSIQLELSALGFEPQLQASYEALLRKPHGIILVTGPTGSGKSTTLYTTLKHISDVRRKIITLEDPVEYQLPGITQIQVHSDIGYTFAEGLKAILRHDPDTVLVGEIRDLESAQIAIRAALTGHQMFSTLHTNDAPQAVTRLRDMGVPLYQIMASLNGVLSQRLLRRLCLQCRQPYTPEPSQLVALGLSPEQIERATVYRPKGCSECRELGYRGRLAIHELLVMTPRLRSLNSEEATFTRVAEVARQDGAFFDLRQSAAAKFLQGLTSAEEALSLLGEE